MRGFALALLLALAGCHTAAPGVVADLLPGGTGAHPVVVILGGSEGGQIAADHPLPVALARSGFAVSRLGYFGMPGTPRHQSRIALEPILAHLDALSADPRIDARCIFVAGVSKGAELSLVLASARPDIGAVLAIVPPHVMFQSSRVTPISRAGWTLGGADLPFVPYPLGLTALRGLWQGGDWLALHDLALTNSAAVTAAAIPVERATGPILLMSAEHDQIWPSAAMADALQARAAGFEGAPSVTHLRLPSDHYAMQSPLFLPAAVPFFYAAAQDRGCRPPNTR